LILLLGIIARTVFTIYRIIKSVGHDNPGQINALSAIGRLFLPFHNAVTKRPLYAMARYVFHACLIIVPVFFSGHIALWEESRFEWAWVAIPDAWADWMTLLLLGLSIYFLVRHIIIRRTTSKSDYLLIIITALPFITGYLLTHGTLDSIALLGNNMWTIHILSGELMLLMVVFLFCRIRLNKEKCTACGECARYCPFEAITLSPLPRIDPQKCICCFCCHEHCPAGAMEIARRVRFFRRTFKY